MSLSLISLMSTAILTISLTAVVLLFSSDSNVYAVTASTTDFSLNISDNQAYEEFIAAVSSTPNEFGVILLNKDKALDEKLKDEGVYSRFEQDSCYAIKNAPLDLYVKYKLDKQYALNVTARQNVTVDGELAVKIYSDGIKEFTGVKGVEYLLMHDDKPYYLSYLANVKDFDKYLPQFEQMIKTFKFATKNQN